MKRSLILHESFFTSYFIFLPLSKFLAFRYDMTNCLITFSAHSILFQIHYCLLLLLLLFVVIIVIVIAIHLFIFIAGVLNRMISEFCH